MKFKEEVANKIENLVNDIVGLPENVNYEDVFPSEEEWTKARKELSQEIRQKEKNTDNIINGLKYDEGKQQWYAMPLVLLKPLADVFSAGEKKYATFNCLEPFADSDRRFWNATIRHLESCQLDPLAIDPETGCYHAAQAAFNILLRIYNAKNKEDQNGNKRS